MKPKAELMKRVNYFIFFFVIFLSNCATPSAPIQNSHVSTNTIQPTATPFVETKILPTQKSTPTAVTPTVTLSPTPGDHNFSLNCLVPTSFQANILQGQGFVILDKREGATHSLIVDVQSGALTPLPDNWHSWDWEPSPDENWFLHSQYKSNGSAIRQIINAQGMIRTNVYVDTGWYIRGWLDNEHLITENSFYDAHTGFRQFRVKVLNPFTGVYQEPLINYEDNLGLFDPIPTGYTPITFNPSLNRVVYPALRNEIGFSLQDLEHKKELAFLPSIQYYTPQWSPDGNLLAVPGLSGSQENIFQLFEIDREGNIIQLTDFVNYRIPLMGTFSWSPNMHFIAFWLKSNQPVDQEAQLAILNVETKEVIDFCIPGIGDNYGNAPVWSSDSKQLVVYSRYAEGDSAILIDMERNIAINLGKNLEPVFWLKKVPDKWIRNP